MPVDTPLSLGAQQVDASCGSSHASIWCFFFLFFRLSNISKRTSGYDYDLSPVWVMGWSREWSVTEGRYVKMGKFGVLRIGI